MVSTLFMPAASTVANALVAQVVLNTTPVGAGNFAQNSKQPALSMQLGAFGASGADFVSIPAIMPAQSMGSDALTLTGPMVEKTIASVKSKDMKSFRVIIINILV